MAINRILLAATLVCAGLTSLSADAKPDNDDYIAGCYVAASPAPQLSSITEARFLARRVAVSLPGAFVLKGQGQSMEPLYCDNTLLVVHPKPFDQLERGMSVVFRTKDNRSVTHVLVAKSKDGWRTTGLNNRRYDAIPVTAQNLQGVVVAAYTVVDGEEIAMH